MKQNGNTLNQVLCGTVLLVSLVGAGCGREGSSNEPEQSADWSTLVKYSGQTPKQLIKSVAAEFQSKGINPASAFRDIDRQLSIHCTNDKCEIQKNGK